MIILTFFAIVVEADILASALQGTFEFVAGDPCYKILQNQKGPARCTAEPPAVYQKLKHTEDELFFNQASREYLSRNKCLIEKTQTLTPIQKSSLVQDINLKLPLIKDLKQQIQAVQLSRHDFVEVSGRNDRALQDHLLIFDLREDALRKQLNILLSSTSLENNYVAKQALLKFAMSKKTEIALGDLQSKILNPTIEESEKEFVNLIGQTDDGRGVKRDNYNSTIDPADYGAFLVKDISKMYSQEKDFDLGKLSFSLNDVQKRDLFLRNDLGNYLLNRSPQDIKDHAKLYCQLDDRYGVKRQSFDRIANGIEFASVLAVPMGPYVLASRGLMSLRAAEFLSTSVSIGMSAATSFNQLKSDCGEASINLKISQSCDSREIPAEALATEGKNNNCLLTSVLTAGSFATPLGIKAFLKLKKISGLTDADAEAQRVVDSGINRNVPMTSSSGAKAVIADIKTARQVSESAWQKTEANLKLRGISVAPENEEKIKKIYDSFLCRELVPPPALSCLFSKSGLRVLDAPHLENAAMPDFIKKYLTVDHHNEFGKGLAENTNTGVQLLDMLDSGSKSYVSPRRFNEMFSYVASDNVGDAYGLSTWIVRNADQIRGNPDMITKLKALTRAEDFDLFGPQMELTKNRELSALLNVYDDTIPKVQNTFMDRTAHMLKDPSVVEIGNMQKKIDQILLPKGPADIKFTTEAADQFQARMGKAVDLVSSARVVLKGAPPIIFEDTTNLKANTTTFQGFASIAQYARKYDSAANSAFTISGDAKDPVRQLVLANFPSRGVPLNAPVAGQSQSFLEAILAAEKSAIQKRLSDNTFSPANRALAQSRLNDINAGKNVFVSYENGSLVFGSTYMTATELQSTIEANARLLGY